MILEGIVTTLNSDGSVNVAPMGPIVDPAMSSLQLRPFKSSRTYTNLKAHPEGVFHVVDDVLLLAKAAINRLESEPVTFSAKQIKGQVLEDACRWYEFRIENFDDRNERTNLSAAIVSMGRLRDFFGFNRAKHAVLEAAILATRVHILPQNEIFSQLQPLRVMVEKTAGPAEQKAFELLESYVVETLQ
ncbi:MAG: DUF447 family protein [Planctomycetaceae bacterium]